MQGFKSHSMLRSIFSVLPIVTEQRPQTVRQIASSNSTLLLHLPKLPPVSAYVHLPFCRKRCYYCDFPIIALGSSLSIEDSRISDYIDIVCKEIKATRVDSTAYPPLETVFFGGGTPSLVPPRLVSAILEALSSKFGVSGDAEISIEMDPGTFDGVKVRELIHLGVNRVSLGVQAFQDELLKVCGRSHGVGEVYQAIEIVKSSGVQNWSLDLISSLPHQTLEMWEESLQLTVAAQPTHVSIYDLQVEQNTKFGVLYKPGEFPLPSEDQSADYYRNASRFLQDAGYEHYEISSYCKSGYGCKHNTTYWKGRSFYGFGLGSASYINGLRLSRPNKFKDYKQYVNSLEDEVDNCAVKGDINLHDLAMDVVMLSLRTSDGLDLKAFKEAFGESRMLSICEIYQPHVESGHVICKDYKGTTIAADEYASLLLNESWRHQKLASVRLSDPDGFLLSNELISLAFNALSSC